MKESVKENGNKAECAARLFNEGYNCAQAVLAAFCGDLGMDMESALRLASSFGGGMGGMGQVCGAVTSMFMAAGIKNGYIDPKDSGAKREHYRQIQQLAGKFKDENGSILCSELLKLCKENGTKGQNGPNVRACTRYVRCAAELVDTVLDQKRD